MAESGVPAALGGKPALELARGSSNWSHNPQHGGGTPYRVRIRPPCFASVQGLSQLIEGRMIPDVVPTFGSLNMIGGECDH